MDTPFKGVHDGLLLGVLRDYFVDFERGFVPSCLGFVVSAFELSFSKALPNASVERFAGVL